MPAITMLNAIANRTKAKQIQKIVEKEVGNRKGEWNIYISERSDDPAWTIRIR